MRYLSFRLRGAVASWGGDVGATPTRSSDDHPSKSAIMGIIGSGLGIKRIEDAKHVALCKDYNVAIFVEERGYKLIDYHTSQKSGISPESNLSDRHYYTDALYTVMVFPAVSQPCYTFDEIIHSLNYPVYSLYLGRKSCPPSLPLAPQIIECDNLKQAFERLEFASDNLDESIYSIHFGKLRDKRVSVYWEGNDASLISHNPIYKRDVVLSRTKWQFTNRIENHTILEMEK